MAKIAYFTMFGNAKPVSGNSTDKRRARNVRVALPTLSEA